MIGHWVGTCAEVFMKINICHSLSPPYKDFCNGSTVFIHELLVEPAVNSMFYIWVNQVVRHTPDQEDVSSSNNKWFGLFAGAVTSLYLSKAADWIPENLKPQFISDYQVWVEAVLSLPGNYIGETGYVKITEISGNVGATAVFGALLIHKIYTNVYLQEESLDNERTNTCYYKHPLVNFCRLEEQQLIMDYGS